MWLVLGGLGAATAQEATDSTPTSKAVWSLTSENDLFGLGGTDRNYTNGIRIERVSREDDVADIFKWAANRLPALDFDDKTLRQGFALSHAIFTPQDTQATIPDPKDRPYAGWLYVSGTVIARDAHTQDILQLNLGVVGPSAAGEFVQTNWHEHVIGVETPKGWDYQLKDEPGIELIGQRMNLYRPELDLPLGLDFDYGVHLGGALGNVRTYATGGGLARFGWGLEGNFGPPRIRPALSGAGVFEPGQPLGGYIFAGAEGRYVVRDMTLDGNLWRDSPRVTSRNRLVADLQAGIAVHYSDIQIAFTYVHRTEEFKAQAGPQRFGAVSVSFAY